MDENLPNSLPGTASGTLEAATAVLTPLPDERPAADAVAPADDGAHPMAGARARSSASAGSEAVLLTPEAAIKHGKGARRAAKQKLRTAEAGLRKKAKRQRQPRSV